MAPFSGGTAPRSLAVLVGRTRFGCGLASGKGRIMGGTTPRIITGAVAGMLLLATACSDGVDTSALDAAGSDEAEAASDPDPDEDAAAADDDGADTEAGADTADGGDGETATAGSAVVIIGDERYETDEVVCPDGSGMEFYGTADGPRDNARIHGRFASSMPELIAVSFARGDEGEWAAIAENEVLDRGVLEDYTFDEDAGVFEGSATFIWVGEDGLMDTDSLTDGTFEVRCG